MTDAAPKLRRVSGGDRSPICSKPTERVLNADNRTAMCAPVEAGGKPNQDCDGRHGLRALMAAMNGSDDRYRAVFPDDVHLCIVEEHRRRIPRAVRDNMTNV
jgi:hypothetical protein